MYFCIVKFVKNILDFLIDASIWVALAVSTLVGTTCFNLNIQLNWSLILLTFLGTIFGYNFVKYFEKSQVLDLGFKSKRIIKQFEILSYQEKTILLLSIVSAILCCKQFFILKIETQLVLVVSLILTFMYAVSLGYTTLRNVAGAKIYIVAIVWALVSVLLPILESEIQFSIDSWIILFQRFIFVIVLILPFDIRDLSVDDKKLSTLPQRIGVKYTKFYGLFLLMLFFFLEFFKNELQIVNLVVMPLIFMTTLFFLVLAKENQNKYYSSFFVEGIPVLWFVLLLLL